MNETTDTKKEELPQEEIERRQRIINDYKRFAQHLPPELQAKLEPLVGTPEARSAMLEVLMFAIEFGRKLQDEGDKPIIILPDGKMPSDLFLSMMKDAGIGKRRQ